MSVAEQHRRHGRMRWLSKLWFHFGCVDFDESKRQEDWKCSSCVTKSTGDDENNLQPPSTLPNSDNREATLADSRAAQIKLNLNRLEEERALMQKEIELNLSTQLERQKLQLEKEASRAKYDILRAHWSGIAVRDGVSEDSSGRVGEWSQMLNQVVARSSQEVGVSTVVTTVHQACLPPLSASQPPLNTLPYSSQSRCATLPSGPTQGQSNQPAVHSSPHPFNSSETSAAPGSSVTNGYATTTAMRQPVYPGYTNNFSPDFLPFSGISQPGSSTPITAGTSGHPVADVTNLTQSMPPIINSVRQQMVQYLPNQVNSSIGNQFSVGLFPSLQHYHYNKANNPNIQVNVTAPQGSIPFPQSVYSQVPSVLPPTVPVCEGDSPTARQLAARHVMSKDLPTFSGRSEEWPLFLSAYTTSTEACGYNNVENLGRLQRCLKGNALEAVRSRLLLPSSVPHVMQTLQILYGRPEQIIYALLAKVREVPPPRHDNLKTLVNFGMAVQSFCDHLEAAGQISHLSNPVLLHELVDKLPAHLKLDWAVFKRQYVIVDLRLFGSYMNNLVSAAADVTLSIELSPSPSRPMKNDRIKGFLNAHSATPTAQLEKQRESTVSCLVCNKQNHKVKECDTFKRMTTDDRWKSVHTLHLCRVCLGRHGRKPCRSQARCNIAGCQLRHNPLLHGALVSIIAEPSDKVRRDADAVISLHNVQGAVLLRILPVTLHYRGKSVNTHAFIDEGSSVTLVEKKLADILEAEGVKRSLCLSWTENVTRVEEDSQQITLEISSEENSYRYKIDDVKTVRSLALPQQTLRYDDLSLRYDHIRNLPIKSFENVTPGILIGVKHAHLTATTHVREGQQGEPVAAKTRLGWAVYGPVLGRAKPTSFSLHICDCSSDSTLHDLVKQYFTIESVGVSVKQGPDSEADKRAKLMLEVTTKRVEGGFETGLLWRHDYVEFPDNYNMAARRLECFERRLKSNPNIATNIHRQMEEYRYKGYMHEATDEELQTADLRRVWYLPIGVVLHPKKPNKFRLVWDAAAKVDGVSLNSMLLKGPDLTASLPVVLAGFRERKVAIGGDICEMFHQIKIRKQDKNSQRFLWRDNPEKQPRVFIMDVATFGSTCSPCSAQFIKNRNAEQYAQQYPRAADAIRNRHYVDDYLDSFDTEEEAIKVAKEVALIHRRGGFTMRSWLSNSSEVLRRVGESTLQPEKHIDWDKSSWIERVLGMSWDPKHDVFLYSSSVNVEVTTTTKRGILRCVMSQYDPLGLLSHFLVHGRIIIQDIWRSKTGWDEEINGDILNRWRAWTSHFNNLQQVRINRSYFPGTKTSDLVNLQLHVFVDASECAYACVAYFRAVVADEIKVALVSAKAKVSPLKSLSIPRLELQAALLGARLLKTIIETHSLPVSQKFIWTDSKTVLAWIFSDNRCYRQFVACRVGEILSITDSSEWRWIPTKVNVADLATKWGRGPELFMSSSWFAGPEFLKHSFTQWPKMIAEQFSTIEELRPCYSHCVKPLDGFIAWERFSKWERLHRMTAYVGRFVSNSRNFSRLSKEVGYLTSDELSTAENVLWRVVQSMVYPDEVSLLKRFQETTTECKLKSALSGSSKLYNMSPFLDKHGVIRMEGRIGETVFMSYDARNPIILPKEHRLTFLLVDWYHRIYLHANTNTVVNEIKQRFRIPQLRALVRRVSKSCMQCKVKKAKPLPPKMAPLPSARLSPYTRPFSFVGLDYFGPIAVKVGRSLVKRWIALFTCLTVRAIHLEVVHSLSTESCKMAIRRFLVRRGSPLEIYSDNGTNFIGASRELQEQFQVMNQTLAELFTNINTKWFFNPSSTPHMGGSWERLVRSVKTAFATMCTTKHPNEETLATILVEAEGIVNSRPLTFVPLDADDQEALTPNHFLLSSSSGVIQKQQNTIEPKEALKTNWKLARHLVDQFWHRWVKEYLPTITKRTKWFDNTKPLEPGDLVVVVDETVRNGWIRGRVLSVVRSKDGQVRQALVKIAVLEVNKDDNACSTAEQNYGSGDVGANDATVS
ncbi:uncharacterized protein LOC131429147 [Malaya genurostris]|uniref:uncharacterized protein LOC131429147 n=1 Tax=Malaya genurostris TaxID=325434 RepID=UPI0026F3CF94|nr:uncharacterized protein LOC131429147 [Malaya genurostris]